MPIHIDEPAPGMGFNPRQFAVRGWLWLEERHTQLAAVEAWSGDDLLGESAVFTTRADVSAKYALPDETRTAFAIAASHPTAAPRTQFDLQIRARLRDGSRTPPLFVSRVGPLPPERDPRAMLQARVASDALGLEIGAHARPVEGLTPYYTDAVADFAGTESRVDFLADGSALPIADGTLDYLCSSHVLEHLPDPLAALHEWHRVLRPGGWLYLVVPDQRFTFDHPRPTTTSAHLLEDFAAGRTAATSLEHVDEFIYQTDWSLLHPDVPATERPARQLAARNRYLHDIRQGRPIDIHFHTFTPASLRAILETAGFVGGPQPRFEIHSQAERYPPDRTDGIALLLRRTDSPASHRPASASFHLTLPNAAIPALPLVCPVTLSALHCETTAGQPSELVARADGRRYPLRGSRPVLVPPSSAVPVRAWRPMTAAPAAATATVVPLAQARIDEPAAGLLVDPLAIFVRGWVWLESTQAHIAAVETWAGDTCLGETRTRYERPDVNAALSLPAGTQVGFELFAHQAEVVPGRPLELTVRVRFADGSRTDALAATVVDVIGRDYRRNHFGVLLDARTTAVQRRPQIYTEGPSLAQPNGEIDLLLRRYLGPPPRKLIDVGCGIGSYGRGLRADGYDWFGVEIDAADCAELARLGLPHARVDGRTLPFADGHFDAALCLDVLEHIDEPRAFLREIARVAPRQLIVSVPNCELLGYLWDHLAVPWHMLEADHKNFFTRWSLGALLREFYPDVELRFHGPYPLRTVEGTPLHYHLLAVATRPA
jgi:SAM-dependent methyltransferase/uncharacterized protein YbaR (Trm112 family)